jgi:hypothetical protein
MSTVQFISDRGLPRLCTCVDCRHAGDDDAFDATMTHGRLRLSSLVKHARAHVDPVRLNHAIYSAAQYAEAYAMGPIHGNPRTMLRSIWATGAVSMTPRSSASNGDDVDRDNGVEVANHSDDGDTHHNHNIDRDGTPVQPWTAFDECVRDGATQVEYVRSTLSRVRWCGVGEGRHVVVFFLGNLVGINNSDHRDHRNDRNNGHNNGRNSDRSNDRNNGHNNSHNSDPVDGSQCAGSLYETSIVEAFLRLQREAREHGDALVWIMGNHDVGNTQSHAVYGCREHTSAPKTVCSQGDPSRHKESRRRWMLQVLLEADALAMAAYDYPHTDPNGILQARRVVLCHSGVSRMFLDTVQSCFDNDPVYSRQGTIVPNVRDAHRHEPRAPTARDSYRAAIDARHLIVYINECYQDMIRVGRPTRGVLAPEHGVHGVTDLTWCGHACAGNELECKRRQSTEAASHCVHTWSPCHVLPRLNAHAVVCTRRTFDSVVSRKETVPVSRAGPCVVDSRRSNVSHTMPVAHHQCHTSLYAVELTTMGRRASHEPVAARLHEGSCYFVGANTLRLSTPRLDATLGQNS